MKSKKKYVIGFWIVVLLGVALTIGMVSVLASFNVTSKSGFHISYEAIDACATIKGSVHTNNYEYKKIDIETDGSRYDGNFEIPEFKIDPQDVENSAYVDLAITNLGKEGEEEEFFVTPNFTVTNSTNIKHSVKWSFDSTNNYKEVEENNICVFKNQTIYLRIQFKALDLSFDAKFDGEFTLNLIGRSSTSLPTDLCTSTIAATGEYPQDYVGSELNETLKSETLTATGKTYTTTDINGTATTLTEYEYNGEKFAKLASAKVYGSGYYFSTDNLYEITDGATYFFRVQPIRVNLFEIRDEKLIFLTKSALFSKKFDSTTTTWGNSDIREYLNSTFLSDCGINATATTIENNKASGNYTDAASTTDTLWLPSKTEVQTTWYTTDEARIKDCSDMALATYCCNSSGASRYWTRSAYSSTYVCRVLDDGGISSLDPNTNGNGICFAFAI